MADATLRAVITAEDRASKVIADVGKSVDGIKGKLEKAVGASTAFAGGLAAFGLAAGGLITKGVQVAGQLESMRQGFVTLLGSAEKADATMARIKQEAARTPFELPGLTSATQALALVTKDGNKSIDVLLNVGKALATAGKGQVELDRIIANLQQIALTGKITEMDIRQFGMSGINILELLADHYGTTTAKAGEMVKDSSDAFGDLTKAFEKAGGEGGKFADGFKNQAGTFQQVWSNLSDTINIALSDFVKNTGIFDAVKDGIQRLIDVLPTLLGWVEITIKFFAEHRELLVVIAGIILGGLVPAIYAAATAFGVLALNLAPFIIGGAIIGGVVAGIWWIIRHWDELKAKAEEIWGAITSYISDQCAKITQKLKDTWNGITEDFKTTWNTIKDYVQGKVEEVKGIISSLGDIDWSAIGITILEGFKTAYLGLWSYVIDTWSGWFKAIGDFFTETYKRTAEGLIQWGNSIAEWFTSMPGKLVEWFDTWNAEFSRFIEQTYNNITSGLQRWLDNFQAWFNSLPERTKTWLDNTRIAITDWFNGLFEREDTIVAVDKASTDMVSRMVEALDKNKLSLIGKWALIIAGVIVSLPLLLVAAIITFVIDMTLRLVKAISDNAPKIRDALVDAFKNAFMSVVDSIGGWITQIVGKINSGLSQIKTSASNAVSSLNPLNLLKPRAFGGAVNPNQSFLVGERGPELFTPNGYGQITRNSQIPGGGIVVNVYGDVSGNELIDKVKRGIMNELKLNAQI